MTEPVQPRQWLSLVRPMLTTLFLCLLLGGMLKLASLADVITASELTHWVNQHGRTGWLVLGAVAAIIMTFGFPRQVIAFLGGSMLGAVEGTIITTLIGGLSCALGFWMSRLLLQSWVKRTFPGIILRLQPILDAKPFIATLTIRMLPAGSNALTNLVAGVSTIRARYFVSASMVGYIPQMLTFALMGEGMDNLSSWQLVISLTLFVCAALLGVYLYRWYQRQLNDEVNV